MAKPGRMGNRGAFARLVRAAALLSLLLPLSVHASHDPRWLAELVKAGDFRQAFDYALEHRAAHEGEPEFDFHYGVAALQVGRLEEGVFALERVVTAEPGFDRARLELARGYFLLGDDRRARNEFEAVLAHDPPPAVAAQIERYLLAMDRRADRYETRVSGYVELSGGHDSNVNAATSDDSVEILGGIPVALDESSQALDDSFLEFEARGNLSHPLRPGLNLIAGAGLWDRSLAEESDFETGAVDGQLGLMLRGPESSLMVSGQAQRFYLGGEVYRDLVGASGSYRRTLSDSLSIDVSGQLSELQFDDNPALDSTLWQFDAGFSRAFPSRRRPVLSGGVFLGAEDPEQDTASTRANTERDIAGFRSGLWLALAPRWVLRADFEYRRSEYAGENALFLETRVDDYYSIRLTADWRPDAHWRIGPELSYAENDSNIDLFAYDRSQISIRARYEFF